MTKREKKKKDRILGIVHDISEKPQLIFASTGVEIMSFG